MSPFLILIAGGSGSGKTTVAKMIKEQSGKNDVLLIPIDNYYKDLSHLKLSARKNVNFDHPTAIDWPLLKTDITALFNGESIRMPIYSFKTATRPRYKLVKPKRIIILEGIFSLYDPELNSTAKLRIFVDTPPDVRLIRRIQRDIAERGKHIDYVIKQWLTTVKPMHDEFIEPTKGNAHVIMPEDPEGGMRGTAIELIKTKIRSMLK